MKIFDPKLTGSIEFQNPVQGNIEITGDLVVPGSITAREFKTEFVSASIIYQSGSTQFGNSSDDTHTFVGTGSFDKVGIGTTEPSTTLDINGGYKWNGVARLTDLAYFIGSSTYGFRFNSAADDYNNVIFYDNGKAYFRSNVGIGTNNPLTGLNDTTYRGLHIDGTYPMVRGSNGATNYWDLIGDATATYLQSYGARNLIFNNNGSQVITIDSNGNAGLGVTPATWSLGSLTALQVRNGGFYGYDLNEVGVTANAYYNNGWKYISTDSASMYFQDINSNHVFRHAASGTAGNAITWVETMRINTAGNVGIGTDNPQSELNIFHATDPEIKMTINTHGDAGVILADADGLKIYGKGSGDQIRLYTNTTEALRVNSSGVITIGAPSSIATAAKLQIGEALSAGSSAALQVNGFARIEHGLLIHWDSDNTQAGYIQYGGANGFAFTTEGAGNGNVGIGITTPGYKLDVQGTMLATGTTRLATSSDATVTIGDARNSQPASSDTKLILSGKNLESGGTYYGDYGQILFNATANYTGSARKWLISNGYATNKFAIIRGGDSQVTPTLGAGGGVTNGTIPFVISDDGRVGVNNTGPDGQLDINGGPAMTGGWSKTAVLGATYPTLVFNSNNSRWAAIAYDHSAALRIYVNAASTDATSTTPVFNILNNGYVGIGTTSPVRILHVENTTSIIHVQSTGLNENASIWFNSNVGGTQASRWEVGTNISAGASLEVYDRLNSQSRMIIQNDGKVGIGTTSPSISPTVNSGLHVSNNNYIQLRLSSTVNSAGMEFVPFNGGSAHNYEIQASSAGDWFVYDRTAESYRFKIDSSGNVGIGLTSPVAKLHIHGGSISSDTPTLRISSTDSSGTNKFGIEFYSTNGADVRGKLLADNNGRVYIDDNGGGGVVFQTNGGSGNVGIGTASPDQKLQTYGSNANMKLVQSVWKNGSGNQSGPKISFHNGGNSSEQWPEIVTLHSIDSYANGGAFDGELSVKVAQGGVSTQVARFSKYGLSFGADDPGSSNALDDYEEGTWTPTGGVASYTRCTYTKIGRTVFLQGTIKMGVSSSGTGIGLGGIPFNSTTSFEAVGSVMYNNVTIPTNAIQLTTYLYGGSNTVAFYWSYSTNSPWTIATYSQFSNSDIILQLTYQI